MRGHDHKLVLRVLSDVIVPVLFIVLIPVGFSLWWLERENNHTIYEQQVASCERGNELRLRLNDLTGQNAAAFGAAAEVLRRIGGSEEVYDLADKLTAAADDIARFPKIDCKSVVHHP